MRVIQIDTGEPVGELTKDFRVKGGVLRTRDGPLKLPRELPLKDSWRDGDTIKDGFTMVKPGQRGYRDALYDWLTMEGLEIQL